MTERQSVLVLGGTSWLGGAVARHASARGHHVVCLARGASGGTPPGVELVRADRDERNAYDEVRDRSWDVVIDVARQPLRVQSALDALAGQAGHWVFVSTLSVYARNDLPHQDESALLHAAWPGPGPAPDVEYGAAKVACEEAVLSARPDALVARSGLIVGDGDRSDRFGYWPARLAQAATDDEVLVPMLDRPCQVIDVEDLARWLVTCGERRVGGVANAVGDPTTLGEVLADCADVTGVVPRFVEASDDWLVANGVEPWMGPESLPLWLPESEYAGFMTRSTERAKALGLVCRPVVESVRGSLSGERRLGLDRPRHAGLSLERERELLATLNDKA